MGSDTRKVSPTLIGAAAEHYVMSQLLMRGCIAALAPTGAPFADIIVSDLDARILCALQVKARTSGSDGGWHMSEKHEEPTESAYLY